MRRISSQGPKDALGASSICLLFYFNFPDHTQVAKITGRRQCVGCGRSFNLAHIKIPEKGINLPPLLPKKEGICDDCDVSRSLLQTIDHLCMHFLESYFPCLLSAVCMCVCVCVFGFPLHTG